MSNKIKVSVSNLDLKAGTWSVPEKRKRKIRDNSVQYFSSKSRWGTELVKALEAFDSESIVSILKLYKHRREELEILFSFARRYKQAVDEIEPQDLDEVRKLVLVKSVMDL